MAPLCIVLQLLLAHPRVHLQDMATTTDSFEASTPSPFPEVVISDIDIIIIGSCTVLTIFLVSVFCLCARNACRPTIQPLEEDLEDPRPRNEESVVFERNVLRDASPEMPPSYEEAIRMSARAEVCEG